MSIRVVVATGDGQTRGLTIGAQIADLIQDSVDFYQRYFRRRDLSPAQIRGFLEPHLAAAQTALPDLVATLRGMAEGADVSFDDLFAINAFEELEPVMERAGASAAERCTSFSLVSDDATIVAHNEHWLAGDLGNVAVIVERIGEAWTASPTIAPCLGASGINSHGGAVGIQSVTADDDRPGVPRVLVSRNALAARGPSDALQRTDVRGRAGGYGFVYGFRDATPLRIETTATRDVAFDGVGVHTNHYLDPAFAAMAPAPSASSRGRYEAVTAAVTERAPHTPEDAMAILRDVDFIAPTSGDDDDDAPAEEADAIVFSMVAELRSGRFWVAPGDPKTTPYEEVTLPDAA